MADINDVFTATKAYVEFLTVNNPAFQAEQDFPLPKGDYTIMTPITVERRGTNTHKYDIDAGKLKVKESVRFALQIDCYGHNSYKNIFSIQVSFLDTFATKFFKPYDIQPLDCSTIRDMTFINETNTFESRYMIELTFDIEDFYTHGQDFFDRAKLKNIYPVR